MEYDYKMIKECYLFHSMVLWLGSLIIIVLHQQTKAIALIMRATHVYRRGSKPKKETNNYFRKRVSSRLTEVNWASKRASHSTNKDGWHKCHKCHHMHIIMVISELSSSSFSGRFFFPFFLFCDRLRTSISRKTEISTNK